MSEPAGLTPLQRRSLDNMRRRRAALPPIDTDERWCDPCMKGEHHNHVDIIDANMACWCPTCDTSPEGATP